MASLADYKKAVEAQRDLLSEKLANGVSSAYEITLVRLALTRMEEEIALRPEGVVNRWELAAGNKGQMGPTLWQIESAKAADKELRKLEPTEAQWLNKSSEYEQALQTRLAELNVKTHTAGDCETRYFIEENPHVNKVKAEFRRAVNNWVLRNRFEPDFYKWPVVVGLAKVLEERQDIVVALRAAQDLGAGKVTPFPAQNITVWDEMLLLGIELLPYIGNAVTLVQAAQGRDLFCRKLSTGDRVLMVAFFFLPAVLKIAKGGKALYTATRLTKLYPGRDTTKWAYMIIMGERATANPAVRNAVREAGKRLLAKQGLTGQAVQDVEKAFAILTGKAAGAATAPPSRKALLEALKKIVSAKASLAELDELALQRVVDAATTKKGFDLGLAKGQLLEELKESRTVKLLQEQFGGKALGIDPAASKYEYFPGHMVTDVHGKKLTDGFVARRLAASEVDPKWYGTRNADAIAKIQGVLELAAVDEAKAGRSSAKGLGYKYDVTEADREALKAVAAKRFSKLQAAAAKEGKPVGKTLETVEKEVAEQYKLGEIGGQARSTVERLDALEDGSLTSVLVGDDEYLIRIRSISKIKVFGVLPRDVPSKGLVKAIRKENINFEVLGLNVTQSELEDMARTILDAAAKTK